MKILRAAEDYLEAMLMMRHSKGSVAYNCFACQPQSRQHFHVRLLVLTKQRSIRSDTSECPKDRF